LPFVGTYIWLQHEHAEVKKVVREKLEEGFEPKELVTLIFIEEELSQIRWEHEQEFEFQGQMYDVVEKKEQGDSTIFICWWDHEETQLKKELNQLLAGQQNDFPLNKDSQNRLTTFGKALYAYPVLSSKKIGPSFLKEANFLPYLSYPSCFPQSPPTPPPDWA
jgi:hypothetical protein